MCRGEGHQARPEAEAPSCEDSEPREESRGAEGACSPRTTPGRGGSGRRNRRAAPTQPACYSRSALGRCSSSAARCEPTWSASTPPAEEPMTTTCGKVRGVAMRHLQEGVRANRTAPSKTRIAGPACADAETDVLVGKRVRRWRVTHPHSMHQMCHAAPASEPARRTCSLTKDSKPRADVARS